MINLLKEIGQSLLTFFSTVLSYLTSGIAVIRAILNFVINLLQFFGFLTGSDLIQLPAFVTLATPLFIGIFVIRILIEVF